jgi:hypothetical protein
MNYFTYILIILLTLTNCVDKNPELNEADYIQFQKDYEEKVKSTSNHKKNFFSQHKTEIQSKIQLFKTLKDSLRVFEEEKNNKNYFLRGKVLIPINYYGTPISLKMLSSSKKERVSEVVFLAVNGNRYAENTYKEAYSKLYDYDFNGSSLSGENYKDLKRLVGVKYAFVTEGKITEPKIVEGNGFQPGLFEGSFIFYDLENTSALYKFSVSAASSDNSKFTESNYSESQYTEVLNQDLVNNIRSATTKEIRKHFVFN